MLSPPEGLELSRQPRLTVDTEIRQNTSLTTPLSARSPRTRIRLAGRPSTTSTESYGRNPRARFNDRPLSGASMSPTRFATPPSPPPVSFSMHLREMDHLTEEHPDGGSDAWLTVIGGFLVCFCTAGVAQSFGAFQDYYKRNTLVERTPSDISWIGSVQIFFMFAMGIVSGRLLDNGYFHTCLLGGSLLYLISIFLLSLVKPDRYYQNMLSQGVGMGIGQGLLFLPSITVISHYFCQRRALAMSIVMSGSSIGGVIYPILLNSTLPRWGFAWSIRAVGFIDLGLLFIANMFMAPRLPMSEGTKWALKSIWKDWGYIAYMTGPFLVMWGLYFPC
ncbi:hypothetical protein HGRIS_014063 [Hohenbuehelia grisea]|uniref:MFS general substrate transporter n=1 Tax=Hohenbuehelia grisea TaxID=104357 RepID=A0ABR3JTW8_9AGAR